jgi:ABC-type glycerol-3-phosphate transport system substrate-binding protein
LTYVYHHPRLGPKFIERVLSEMDATMFRDLRQGTDWLSQGKYALCFLCRRIDRAAMQKLPVAELDPYQIEEQPGIGSGSGALVVLTQQPHPYAARLFVNWFLSPEGQTAFLQANTDEFRIGSLREDLPPELVPPPARRKKDKQYIMINRPDWMDFTPIQNLLDEILKNR